MSDEPSFLKLYTDKHIARAVTIQLRLRGVDVVRCEDVGMAAAKDVQHLEYATAAGRTVVTHDEDFLRLAQKWLAEGRSHAGIMFLHAHLQGRPNIGRIVKGLLVYHELIDAGAGTVEGDIYNRVLHIT
jgi:hypothetical protein